MDLHNFAPWPQHPKLLLLPSPQDHPDSKVQRANMGPTWGREDPDGPHVGPLNFAIWAITVIEGVGTDGMLSYQCLAVLLLMTGVEPNPGPLNDKRPVGLHSFAADSNCDKEHKTWVSYGVPIGKEIYRQVFNIRHTPNPNT